MIEQICVIILISPFFHTAMTEISQILKESQCSLVVSKDGAMETYVGGGVKPLLQLFDSSPQTLKGADVADKVVGKAAASIMVVSGVKSVYTPLISEPARQLLSAYNIPVSYEHMVPNILNRQQSDLCPMEQATKFAATPTEAVAAIREAIKRMMAKR